MKITDLSIRRPKLTIVGMILFILLGGVSLTNLPLQLFPEIDPPVAAVVTSYPGASPEEVEESVTIPLEEQLSTMPGLNNITSTSEEGSALILLEFSWDTSIDDVEQDVISAMGDAPLPDDAADPSFLKFDPSMFGMAQIAVTSDDMDVVDFQDDLTSIRTELERVEGVANVDESGRVTERYEINLNQEQLEQYQVTQEDVVNVIQSNNVSLPGGTVESGERTLTTRVLKEIEVQEDLEDLFVTIDPETGDELFLSDVADISLSPEEQNAITRTNQQPAMQLNLMKETDANAATVSSSFNSELDTLLEEDQYSSLEFTTFYDEGDYIQQSINSVTTALITGGVFAMLVLFFFLRNLKTPLIIGVAIPFSVIVTFGFLYFTDVGLNLMTLGGLALGIGMLVDNAIVVIENIYRHLSMGKTPKKAASEGTKEVGGAITASTLTTVSVFLPIIFVSGIVGNIFTEFALAVSFSLIASLFVAVTVVPMMASRILKAPKENIEEKRQNSRYMKRLEKASKWSLKHRFLTLFITLLFLIAGGAGLATTGVNFLPASDQGFFSIDVETDYGTNLETTTAITEDIEAILDEEGAVDSYLTMIGSSGDGGSATGGPSGSNEAQVMVTMEPMEDREESTIDFIEQIEDDVINVDSDADISLSSQTAIGGGEANTVVFTISDQNVDALNESTQYMVSELRDAEGIREVTTSDEDVAPEIQIAVNEENARDNGLAAVQIAESVDNATRGQTATTVQTADNTTYDVIVQYETGEVETAEDLETLLIANQEGEYIELGEVADIEEGSGPAVINRDDQQRSVEITAAYSSDTTLNQASNTVTEIYESSNVADSTSLSYSGEQELLDDALDSMIFAFILGLLFIYLVMAGQFESFKYPFIVMFSVPLVVIGVSIALAVTQTPLSVTVFIGLIVLAGIVVNNAIVLVDYINQQKEKGMASKEAIVESVKQRTRPILMTAVTTILGVVPLSLGIGEGAEIQQPMGIAVIGGLVSSTFLTLFVIPVLYSFLDKNFRKMRKEEKKAKKERKREKKGQKQERTNE